jgi:hypothetical protein
MTVKLHVDSSKGSSHRNEFVSSGTSPTPRTLSIETLRFIADTLEEAFNKSLRAGAE